MFSGFNIGEYSECDLFQIWQIMGPQMAKSESETYNTLG